MANAVGNTTGWLVGLRPSQFLSGKSSTKTSFSFSPKRLVQDNASSPSRISRRFSPCRDRMLGGIGCLESLIPWHNVTSEARLVSRISTNMTAFYEVSLSCTPSSMPFSTSLFLSGDGGNFRALCFPPVTFSKRSKRNCPKAASDDVPSYKGYPPMTKRPKWWWRVLACIPYLMPLCETWMYAETAYSLHAFLEDFEFCTYPFLALLGKLPGWFLLAYFFVAYLGIVRNNRWPHFVRFHVVTGMLLEIMVQVMGTVNDWIPQAIYWGKIGAHFWLAGAFAFLFTVIECIRCALRGMYADVPFLSDAAYMQIPYD